ncbi:hypothetical protein GpartN1_g570.t1 [Galdieria partita]|uniref:mRNA-decapping enzyme-like protein n=1 Tax=Galdieria partita TaxID=83374 RepID=A0A9C7PRA4_9RHOD|nr:hypothetical protein GpartN1_g570.t1 [Galdieria partita]
MVEKGLEEKGNSRQERKELALKQNIQVLSRYFSGIRSILFYAHNVCVYDFDEANKCWKRSEIEGAFHIVDNITEIPYRIIVLNRRELENLALDIVPGWTHFEEVKGTIQLQSPQGKIYAFWFFDEEEKIEAVKVLSLLLEQQKPAQDYLSANQKLYGSEFKASDPSYAQQTPEKEILRLLKSPLNNHEMRNNGAGSSPLQKHYHVLSPGRLGSPFPSNNNVMRNMPTLNYTNFSETSRDSVTSTSSVEAGRQILSLLKHVESSSLNETNVANDLYASSVGHTSSRNSSFNVNFSGREQSQSDAMKEYSALQLQSALQALAHYSSNDKERLKESETGDRSEIVTLFKRFDWKDTLLSLEQLKELLSTILQDDVLFHQFYEQYIKTVKSASTGGRYSSIP